MKLLLYADTAA